MTQVRIDTALQRGYGTLDGFTPVDIPEDIQHDDAKQLYVINNLLAEQRKKAWDHERGGEMFHGAALIRTKAGKYYMAANIHLQNPKTTRNCAEANAATSAVNVEGIDMEITDLWFMGGKGDLEQAIEIMPSDYGRLNTPCGSCLDVIWNNRLGRMNGAMNTQTQVHMLPLNQGGIPLKPDNGCHISEREPDQVMTRSIRQLLPFVRCVMPDVDGEVKRSVRAGWELINEPLTMHAVGRALQSDALLHLNQMKDASKDELLREVNNVMVDALHDLCVKSQVPLKSARVAVVRLDGGEYYMGVSLENGYTTAMQPAESDAIQSALRAHPTSHAITDMFVMGVDFEKMPERIQHWEEHPRMDVHDDTIDGAARDRLSKAGPRGTQVMEDVLGRRVDKKTGASVHVILLNDKESFHPDTHMVTRSVQQLLPYRFISPKMNLEQALGVH
jgi:cytidine deaminase